MTSFLSTTRCSKGFSRRATEDSQPINHVDGREPPIFLVVGTTDHTVDAGNTARLAARLHVAHDHVELNRYADVNHAMAVGSLARPVRATFINVAPELDDVSSFINSNASH